MIPIEKLSLIDTESAAAGAWLIRPTRYVDGPAFRCLVDGRASTVPIGGDPQRAFKVYSTSGDGPWLVAEGAQIAVNPHVIASPFKGDIPAGSICIVDGEACLSASYNYSDIYISLRTGEVVARDFNRFAAFTDWTFTVPGHNGERFEVYSSSAAVTATASAQAGV